MVEKFDIFGEQLIKYNGTDREVIIPKTIQTINDFAFYGCQNVEVVKIPEGVISIGSFAFYGCEKLKVIDIPKSVQSIGGGAFSCCYHLDSITLPNTLTSITKSTFYKCHHLKNIDLPNTIKTIGHSAFGFCQYLRTIKLPDSLITIEENAFEECIHLESIDLPKTVTTIGKKAFFHCSSLKNLTLSQSLETVGHSAFETESELSVESNDTLLLRAVMFDSNWNLSFKRKEDKSYQFVQSYLPNIDFKEWKAEAKIILLVNFLETYTKYQADKKESYYQYCLEYKQPLIEFLVTQKRYAPLNQAIEVGIITTSDLEPYFNQINNREQRAKLIEYKNKENQAGSILSDLENELMNM